MRCTMYDSWTFSCISICVQLLSILEYLKMMNLKPIKPKRISDQVFEQIRELIYKGEFKPVIMFDSDIDKEP